MRLPVCPVDGLCTLKRRLNSYCCVICNGSASFVELFILYICGVACLIPFSCISPVKSCADSIVRMRWLLSVFCSTFFLLFPYPFMLAPACGRGAGAGRPKSEDCSRDTGTDHPFLVSNFICEYDAYLDSRRVAPIWMTENSESMLDVRFQHICSFVGWGGWKKRWWHWGGRGASFLSLCIAWCRYSIRASLWGRWLWKSGWATCCCHEIFDDVRDSNRSWSNVEYIISSHRTGKEY